MDGILQLTERRASMRETTRGRLIYGALVLVCAVLSSSCSLIEKWIAGDTWQMPRVVQVKGIESMCYYPPTWCATARAGRPVRIPARDGDVFHLPSPEKDSRNEFFFPYRGNDGDSFVLEAKDDVLFLNGKAVSLKLSEKGWQWLRKASIEDMAGLRYFEFKEKAGDVDFPLLEKLARVRSEIGLGMPDLKQPDVAAQVISLFEPSFLIIELSTLSAQFDSLKPRLGKLEILWTSGKGSLDFLPRLTRLHTLLLSEWAPAGSGAIPSGSSSFRFLTIMRSKEAHDLSFLRNLTGLQELVLWSPDELKDISALAALPGLKKLVLWGDPMRKLNLAVLEQLPRLAWLGVPLNTTQEDFAKIIASHPGLEVIELVSGNDSRNIHDLSPLRSLRNLKAAIILQEKVDLGPLQDLKSLQYLALPKSAFEGEAAAKTAALEKALPKTFVAQATPFCLGSGWILLLIPAIVLLRRLWQRGHGLRSMAGA